MEAFHFELILHGDFEGISVNDIMRQVRSTILVNPERLDYRVNDVEITCTKTSKENSTYESANDSVRPHFG